MSSLNHTHIIGPITDAQCYLFCFILDQIANLDKVPKPFSVPNIKERGFAVDAPGNGHHAVISIWVPEDWNFIKQTLQTLCRVFNTKRTDKKGPPSPNNR
jgi:hypothetical protein